MKKIVLPIVFLLIMCGKARAPEYVTIYEKIEDVRIMGYSTKEPYESAKLPNGKSAKNERGCAVLKGFLPYGTVIICSGGIRRVVDDRTPEKVAGIIGTRKIVELRWYQSIKSKPKTRRVKREIMKRFDKGWGDIWIERRVEKLDV